MSDAWFERLFKALCRHPRLVALAMCAVTALAIVGLKFVPFEGSLEIMLPTHSEARRTVTFLRDANFSDKVAISISMDREELGLGELTAEMDRLAEKFRASPLVKQVLTFPSGDAMIGQVVALLNHAPELLDAKDLEGLPEKLTPESIDRGIRRCYVTLLRPEGSFMQEVLRRDPLDITSGVLGRLRRMPEAVGYQVSVQNGHLIHPDGRHGLLIVETGVAITDGIGSRQLVELVRNTCALLPEGFTATVTCGHMHSVANEDKLRRDIGLIGILASIAFPLLFLIMFRDVRSILIFLMPAASILVAIHISRIILGPLSYMMVGFGAVLAGAADYGTHVFVGMKYGTDRYTTVRRIVAPILLSSLNVAAVFVAFFASEIEGYRQLAVFALITIALSVSCSILLLPPFLKLGGRQAVPAQKNPRQPRRWPAMWGVAFLVALLLAIIPASRVRLDTDLRKMDGTDAEILRAEEQFEALWSGGQESKAIAVAQGATYDEAARRNDELHARAEAALPAGDFVGMNSFWPSAEVRAGNLRRWRAFWTEERIRGVRERVESAAAKQGFSDDAFRPFFDLLAADISVTSTPEDSAILTQVHDRLVRTHSGGYWFLSFFPDTAAARESVGRAVEAVPGAFIVSRAGLASALADSISAQVVRISVIGLALILVITFALMGNLRLTLAALLPPATSVMWMCGIMGLAGMSFNIANMMAGIVVFGLCMEYGIFMAHAHQEGEDLAIPTRHAMSLTAGTTLLGAAVLLFAHHPALFSIGLTLVIGLVSGYLAALLGVPGLCALLKIRAGEK